MRPFLFFLFLTVASPLFAQWDLGIHAKIHDPKGSFNTNVEGIAGGLGIRALRNSNSSRWSFGGEIGVSMYSRDQYLLETSPNRFEEVEEEDCFWTVHAIVQYSLYQNEAVRVYGEARAGITTFFSTTTAVNSNSRYNGRFRLHGTAFNTGLGGGMTLNTGKIFTGSRNRINIDLGANLHSGSKTHYRDMNNVDSASSLDEGRFKSLTHYIAYRFGVLINL